jgi:hypothetical protein
MNAYIFCLYFCLRGKLYRSVVPALPLARRLREGQYRKGRSRFSRRTDLGGDGPVAALPRVVAATRPKFYF